MFAAQPRVSLPELCILALGFLKLGSAFASCRFELKKLVVRLFLGYVPSFSAQWAHAALPINVYAYRSTLRANALYLQAYVDPRSMCLDSTNRALNATFAFDSISYCVYAFMAMLAEERLLLHGPRIHCHSSTWSARSRINVAQYGFQSMPKAVQTLKSTS